ncbi:GNAT family N-acetyltransferase [Lapidilactobacillus wuchangensis]|uniref:GNAT family N-acetyltransferase n=1 Tax=Lapidilactobacillus wuchangensis TaxID=2486001 RepID=UPI000F79B506|nr:GNAT family N-acetyltransferase [Lapidilactobacillus wuchangensis]
MTKFTLAQQKDLPRIVDIYNQAIPGRLATADLEPVSIASKQAWFDAYTPDKRPLWLIQDDQEQTIGWVGLESFYGRPAYQHTAEISIYLDSAVAHHGYGRQALSFVETQLTGLKLDTLVAFIFHHNIPSQHLFLHHGFQQWAHLPEVALMDGQLRDLDILGKQYPKITA